MVTDTLTEQVARNVRQAMVAAGENPHSLASATGIPRSTLLRRLNGQQPFDVAELDRIARHLSGSVPAFFEMQVAA